MQCVLVGCVRVCGRRMRRPRLGGRDAVHGCGPGTYSNERESAFRIDSDGTWLGELGDGAGVAFVDAPNARAGERGHLPVLEIELPDAVIVTVLRYV